MQQVYTVFFNALEGFSHLKPPLGGLLRPALLGFGLLEEPCSEMLHCLSQVFQIAAHLVYWGKAIIIYPLCENNVYMLSPHANICM